MYVTSNCFWMFLVKYCGTFCALQIHSSVLKSEDQNFVELYSLFKSSPLNCMYTVLIIILYIDVVRGNQSPICAKWLCLHEKKNRPNHLFNGNNVQIYDKLVFHLKQYSLWSLKFITLKTYHTYFNTYLNNTHDL